MVKKKKVQEEISQKDYKEIYDIFVSDKNTGALLKLSNQILTMYEMYDEADDEIRKRNASFRINPQKKKGLPNFPSSILFIKITHRKIQQKVYVE